MNEALHKALTQHPWLEELLSPCLWSLDKPDGVLDLHNDFEPYARGPIGAAVGSGHLTARQGDELLALLRQCDHSRGPAKRQAIDATIDATLSMVSPKQRLAEAEAMRPRRRATRQGDEEALPKTRSVADDPLTDPLTVLDGLGPKRAERFAARGVRSLEDLLNWLPAGYEDRAAEVDLDAVEEGSTVSVRVQLGQGRIEGQRGFGRPRYVLPCTAEDGGTMTAVFFQPSPQMWQRQLGPRAGTWARLFGRIGRWKDQPAMIHPKIEHLDLRRERRASGLHPIYPDIPGIKGPQMRRIITQALEHVRDGIIDPLDQDLRRSTGFPGLWESWRLLHMPRAADSPERRQQAAERFAFQELFLTQMGLLLRRQASRGREGLKALDGVPLSQHAKAMLPFTLTAGQSRSLAQIDADLRSGAPMNRLLQGDVGSGKTAVAAVVAYGLAQRGFQSAMMAPTELLARQHAQSIEVLLQGRLRIGLLTGSVTGRARRHLLEAVAAGDIDLLVGTHALVAQPFPWKALALTMVDEQHRFGVAQRKTLREAARASTGFDPHTLAMTATPIPRTLAMTVWGDLDVSVIRELPPGRKPVHTFVFRLDRMEEPMAMAEAELAAGRQIFVVLPLVRESETMDLADAERVYEELRGSRLGRFGVGLLHGQMKNPEKQAVMEAFREGQLRVLVSTTVIEVGVDVPEASTMMVWHAERFGLSQLHQLRGRVGRGEHASRCFLLHDPSAGQTARHRLRVLANCSDGFELAMEDLRLRGPGEMAGVRQSGADRYHHADIVHDEVLLEQARELAGQLLADDPELCAPEHRDLARVLRGRFAPRLAMLDVA